MKTNYKTFNISNSVPVRYGSQNILFSLKGFDKALQSDLLEPISLYDGDELKETIWSIKNP
jgi:hypothetical protein